VDAIEYEWNRRVIGYGQETQLELFEDLFGEVTSRKVIMLMVASTSIVLFLVGLSVIRVRSDKKGSKIENLYRDCCRDLARIGLPRQQGEGPMDYYHRVIQLHPEFEVDLGKITDMYIKLNYRSWDEGPKDYGKSFKTALLQFRLKLAPIMKRAMERSELI